MTEIDKSQNENSHRYPWFLPDGRHFLYTARVGVRVKSSVYVGDLASKDRSQVVEAATNALYVRGYLLFVRNRTLMAQPFHAGKLRTTKGAVPVAEEVSYNANGVYANFAASQDGVLTYTSSNRASTQLTWFDRSGKSLGTVGASGELEMISLSPDQTAVVAVRIDPQTGNADLWLHNLARHTDSRLTFTGSNQYPVWSPDGTHLAFSGARDGSRRVYQKTGNGAGQEEILEAADKLPSDWSRDGRYLITMTGSQNPKTGNDIWVLPLFGERKSFPYVRRCGARAGFAIEIKDSTDLGLAMLIAESEDGQYEPFAIVANVGEAREVAQHDHRSRMGRLEHGESPLCRRCRRAATVRRRRLRPDVDWGSRSHRTWQRLPRRALRERYWHVEVSD